jgi:hypothetical protein
MMPIDPPDPREDDEADTNRGASTDEPAEGADDVNPPGEGSPQG